VGRVGTDGEPEPVGQTGNPGTSLRDALSLIMSDGNRPLVVVDADGLLAGLARVEVIAGALALGNGATAAKEDTPAAAQDDKLSAEGEDAPAASPDETTSAPGEHEP
jgi:hypothetical protein